MQFGQPLRDVLPDRIRPREAAPANFSVVAGDASAPVRTKHVFNRRNRRVFHSRARGRVLRAVLRGLAVYERPQPRAGELVLEATPVLAEDGVVLIDSDAAWLLDGLGPRLVRQGHRVLDTHRIHLDPSDMTADLGLGDDWCDRLERLSARDDSSDPSEIGVDRSSRLPVVRVLAAGGMTSDPDPVASALTLVSDGHADEEALGALAGWSRSSTVDHIAGQPAELVRRITRR